MLVLVLVLIWVVVLAPIIFRKLSEEHVTSSVTRFRQSSTMLRRRFASVRAAEGYDVAYENVISAASYGPISNEDRRRAHQLRQLRIARRRRALTGLVSVLAGSLALGAVPHLHVVWALSLVSGAVLAMYVGLLAYSAKMAADEISTPARRAIAPGTNPSVQAYLRSRYSAARPAHLMPSIKPFPSPPAFVLVDAPR